MIINIIICIIIYNIREVLKMFLCSFIFIWGNLSDILGCVS